MNTLDYMKPNKPLKILMVNDIGTEDGGAEMMIVQLKKALVQKGHSVKILTGQHKPTMLGFNNFTYKSFTDTSLLRFMFYIYNPYSAIKLKKVLKTYTKTNQTNVLTNTEKKCNRSKYPA